MHQVEVQGNVKHFDVTFSIHLITQVKKLRNKFQKVTAKMFYLHLYFRGCNSLSL